MRAGCPHPKSDQGVFLIHTRFRRLLPPCALVGLLAVLTPGCASLPAQTADVPVQTAVPAPVLPPDPVRPDPHAYYHYLNGYNLELRQQYDLALSEYLAALTYIPDSRELLFRTASLYVKNGDIQGAIETAEVALAAYPGDRELLLFLSSLYLKEENFEQAEQTYRSLIARYPADTKPYYLLILANIREERYDQARALIATTRKVDPTSALPDYYEARILRAEGNVRGALKFYRRAIRKDASFEASYLEMADIHERAGKPGKAMALYKTVVNEVNPASSVARDRLIQLYIKQGDLQQVLAQLDGVLRLNPNNPAVLYRKAVVLAENGQEAEAIEVVTRVLNLYPSDIRSLEFLGSLYQQTEQNEAARKVFERVLEVDPGLYRTHIQIGYLAHFMEDPEGLDREVEAAEAALEEHPDDLSLYLFIGWGHSQAKRYEASVDVLERAMAIESERVDIRFSLGAAYYELDRHEDMAREIGWVIDQDPLHADALNFMGYALAERGEQLDYAQELIERALKEKPDTGYILDSLAWVYYMKGVYPAALKYQRRAIEQTPEMDAVMYDHLGSILLETDHSGEARAAWVQSLQLDTDNDDLKERFRQAGFGNPDALEELLTPMSTEPPSPTFAAP